jgi:hypothetical protein
MSGEMLNAICSNYSLPRAWAGDDLGAVLMRSMFETGDFYMLMCAGWGGSRLPDHGAIVECPNGTGRCWEWRGEKWWQLPGEAQ